MKLIRLAVRQISSSLSRNRAMSVLLCTGLFISILTLIYAYGNIVPSKIMETVTGPSYRTVEVVFEEPLPLREDYLVCCDEYGIQDVCLKHITDQYIPEKNCNLTLCAFRDNNKGNEICFRPLFEPEQLTENNIIISSDCDTDESTDEITLDGFTYPIARKIAFMDERVAYIPLGLFQENMVTVDAIGYTFESFDSLDRLAEINATLHACFPTGTIVNPVSRFEGLEPKDIKAICLIAIMFAVCMFTFGILLRHMAQENLPDYIVYGFCGAKRGQIARIIFLHNLFLVCASLAAALILHTAAYPVFDRWINFSSGISYRLSDYLTISCIVLGTTILFQVPFLKRYVSHTLIEMKSRYFR